MNDFKAFLTIVYEVRSIVQVARQVECDGFVDILKEEIKKLTVGHQETLVN